MLLSNCSTNNNDDIVDTEEESNEVVIYQWHLTNVSGGIGNVDTDFEMDTVVWIINVDIIGNGTLKVENNNSDATIEDGLDTGSYSISIPNVNNQNILYINGDEFAGVLTPSKEDLIINQNITTDGPRNGGFIYTFKRKIVVIDN